MSFFKYMYLHMVYIASYLIANHPLMMLVLLGFLAFDQSIVQAPRDSVEWKTSQDGSNGTT